MIMLLSIFDRIYIQEDHLGYYTTVNYNILHSIYIHPRYSSSCILVQACFISGSCFKICMWLAYLDRLHSLSRLTFWELSKLKFVSFVKSMKKPKTIFFFVVCIVMICGNFSD